MTETTWRVMSTNQSSQSDVLAQAIDEADAVVVGIGAGMSASDGFTYIGKRFTQNFPDFIEKYGFLICYRQVCIHLKVGKNTGHFKVDLLH